MTSLSKRITGTETKEQLRVLRNTELNKHGFREPV